MPLAEVYFTLLLTTATGAAALGPNPVAAGAQRIVTEKARSAHAASNPPLLFSVEDAVYRPGSLADFVRTHWKMGAIPAFIEHMPINLNNPQETPQRFIGT
jgi:hypothetical protein